MQLDPNIWQRAIHDGVIPNVPQSSTPLHIRQSVAAYYKAIGTATDAPVYQEDYYQSKTTERLVSPSADRTRRFELPLLSAIFADRSVTMATLVTIGMIFQGVDYFASHGTNAQALIAAVLIGMFIWVTLGPKKG